MAGNTFVVSDLHLGDGGPRDSFSCKGSTRPAEFAAFLDFVGEQDGELIILGDLLELWQCNLSKVISFNLTLLDRLGDMNATYVLGNHDIDLIDFVRRPMLAHPIFAHMVDASTPAPPKIIGKKRFKFMHGHEVDIFNAGITPGWGRMMTIFAGLCEDCAGSPIVGNVFLERLLAGLGEWLLRKAHGVYAAKQKPRPGCTHDKKTPAQEPERAIEMLTLYARNLEDNKGTANEYDVLVAGHTHEPGRIGDWYVNCGSWATSNNNFVQIDASGTVGLFDWVNGKPVPNNTILTLPPPRQPKP